MLIYLAVGNDGWVSLNRQDERATRTNGEAIPIMFVEGVLWKPGMLVDSPVKRIWKLTHNHDGLGRYQVTRAAQCR
jgi:hypothetical protein